LAYQSSNEERIMKTISLLVLSMALATGVTVAQTTPADPTTADSTAADSNSMQGNAPASTMAPSAATDANQSSDAIAQSCMKQATDKKLSGEAKDSWVGKCKQGKTTRQDH
jgi:ABC-type transport system substrate-binding protein